LIVQVGSEVFLKKEIMMRFRSVFARSAGAVAVCTAFAVGLGYRRWKQQQRERLQSESRLLETTRGIIEYEMEGAGSVVLVLHGSPGGYDQGMAIGRLLNLSGHTLLAFSRPGYRRTPLSSGQTPEDQADLYAAALDALKVSQVVVVALSGGGPSALQFALRYPQRCRGLLMISALAYEYTEEEVYRSLPPGQRLLKRLFDRLIVWDPFLYLLWNLSRWVPQEEQSRGFLESLVMNPVTSDGYRNDMQQFAALPVYPFKDVAVPMLIVHGTEDVDVPFWQARELAEAIPGAHLVAVEGANHLSVLAGKQALAAIHGFVERLPSREDVEVKGMGREAGEGEK
jgi:pimeloyl-ACP methyl ester carboxylesterase